MPPAERHHSTSRATSRTAASRNRLMNLLRIALTCFGLIAVTATARGETRAVLVGVAAYRHLDEGQHLSAPRNDVIEMRDLLIKRGVKSQNITILTDPGKAPDRLSNSERERLPTRRNVMAALETLTKNSRRGDLAIVYLSGHGSFQPDQPDDPDRDEEDGFDEVFLPYDVEIGSPDGRATIITNGIVDDELGRFSAAIRDKGVDLWFTLDSCHSGTGMRTSGEARSKFIDPAALGVAVERDLSRPADIGFGDKPGGDAASRSVASTRGKAAFFYASQAAEKAAELPLPLSVPRAKAVWRSAFTHAIVVALARQPNLSYREVVAEANALMRDMAGRLITQTAGYDGDLANAPVIGASSGTTSPQQWPLYDGDRIAAGVLHGLEKGAIVAVFADPRMTDAQAQGHAELREVTATESVLWPLREYPCPFVNGSPACRDGGSDVLDGARYVRLVAPPRDFALAVSSPRPLKDAPTERRSLAAQTHAAIAGPDQERKASRHRLRFDDQAPDLIWWVTPHGFRLAPAGIDVAAFQTGAGVSIPATASPEDLKAATLRAIERAYRVERLRRMAAHDATDADRPQVELAINARNEITRSASCPAGSGAKLGTADGPRAQSCSQVMARVTNTSTAPRYVHVFLIDSDWNIRQVMNRESNIRLGCSVDAGGTGAILAAGASRDCELTRYGRADPASDDASVANVAGYSVLVLSTPARPGMSPPAFDNIDDLNDTAAGATRGGSGLFAFDDELTGEAVSRRGTRAPAPPSIAILDWQLDRSPR
ncbi:MAG: caspase family protein [Pseudolabrys sp.]